MSRTSKAIAPWSPADQVIIPIEARTPEQIVAYGRETLSRRDIASIVSGFDAGGYEMVSTFIWTKAAAALKQQVAQLGMEFVGEMLNRPDLDDDSDPATAIADHEAIRLAESLGMITPTQALRLKQSMQLVTHFAAKTDGNDDDVEVMSEDEARSLLRTCITSILGKPRFEAAVEFAEFRNRLTAETLKPDHPAILAVKSSPYFFIRTALSVLLAAVKTAKGATLEHACGNTMVIVPAVWGALRAPEKWQIGQAYAVVNSNGNRMASAAIKKALLDVKGFDFVPESLRSNTFTEAAARVLTAHFSFNNFHLEREPMEALANLGSTIPMPAFAKCMEATLAVSLGNRWGESWAAQPFAERVLKTLREAQWAYYLNECLPRDTTVLDKLDSESKPIARWTRLVQDFVPTTIAPRDKTVQKLLAVSRKGGTNVVSAIQAVTETLRSRVDAAA